MGDDELPLLKLRAQERACLWGVPFAQEPLGSDRGIDADHSSSFAINSLVRSSRICPINSVESVTI